MGVIVITQPTWKKFLEGHPQITKLLHKVKWLEFIEKLDGFHKEVSNSFSRDFDGLEVEIGDIKFTVTKSFIAQATRLSRIGEFIFKNRGIEREDWKVFLKKMSMNTTIFKKGIPSMTLKSKWRNLLLIIQKFVTYEGRFGCMFFYHI